MKRLMILGLLLLFSSGCSADESYVLSCQENSECESGEICISGRCTRECYLDDDCPQGERCSFHICLAPTPEVGIDAEADHSLDAEPSD